MILLTLLVFACNVALIVIGAAFWPNPRSLRPTGSDPDLSTPKEHS